MRLRRLAAWIAALSIALLAVAGAPGAAAAPTPGSTCAGVWVVVGETMRCATDHATGEAALASAGFRVAKSGSMICRIDDAPATCTISATAYWSYWHAERRPDGTFGAWQYATVGANVSQPRVGDAEGWVFGDGKAPPAILPPAGSTSAAPATPAPAASATPAPSADPTPDGAAGAPGGSPTTTILMLVGLAGGAAALAVWARRRRR